MSTKGANVIGGPYGPEVRCPNCDELLAPKGETKWVCTDKVCPEGELTGPKGDN